MEYRNGQGLYVQTWQRHLFLRVNTFCYDQRHSPVRRPSVSILVALSQPFRVRLPGQEKEVSSRGLLVGPNVLRDRIAAVDSDLWIFDVSPGSLEYRDLLEEVSQGEVKPLTVTQWQTIAHLCHQYSKCGDARSLLDAVVYSLCDRNATTVAEDARVTKVLKLIERDLLDDWTVASLAKQSGLSKSRLRALFVQQMHCTPSYYQRMAALWKSLPLLERGVSFTEAAHAVGFHDLSHFHRAVTEFTGLSPSLSRAIYGTAGMLTDRK